MDSEILQQAHSLFSGREYDKALFLYSQITSLDPSNEEYQLYCLMCDVAYDNEEKAQSMFDYFIIAKNENFDAAIKYIKDIINAYDGDNNKLMNLLKDLADSNVESLNAIEYKDFMALVESRGSFKEAYQDIMFSTKVSISKKDDLVDFIDKLIENDFNNTAYSYLDGFNEFFSYDKDLMNLYDKLGIQNSENKS